MMHRVRVGLLAVVVGVLVLPASASAHTVAGGETLSYVAAANGHLQQLPISDPGFAYGAAVSWCLEANADVHLADALSAHAYADPTGAFAEAVLAIGDAHRALTPQIPNHSILVMHLYFPQIRVGRGIVAKLRGLVNGRQRQRI